MLYEVITVVNHGEDAAVLFGAAAPLVVTDAEGVAAHGKAQRRLVLQVATPDTIRLPAFRNADVGLVTEKIADNGADKDDQDRQVGDVDAETGPGPLFGVKIDFAILLGHHRGGKPSYNFV